MLNCLGSRLKSWAEYWKNAVFKLERIKGSHYYYHNPETKKKSTSVPFHSKDDPKGLLNVNEKPISTIVDLDKLERDVEEVGNRIARENLRVFRDIHAVKNKT